MKLVFAFALCLGACGGSFSANVGDAGDGSPGDEKPSSSSAELDAGEVLEDAHVSPVDVEVLEAARADAGDVDEQLVPIEAAAVDAGDASADGDAAPFCFICYGIEECSPTCVTCGTGVYCAPGVTPP